MTNFESKKYTLKDGKEITIRAMTEDDLEASLRFFQSFPSEELKYLRTDVTKRENVKKRIDLIKTGLVHRLVGIYNNEIIADGALELSPFEWEKHVGEIRIIIRPDFRRKGLGMIMARELYFIANAEKLEKIIARMMRTQEDAIKIFRKLGFHHEIILDDFVKDRTGQPQDLIIMSVNMKELWDEMETYFLHSDMQRHR
jgi:RimJ/RimL family protein N-acetyltransferase